HSAHQGCRRCCPGSRDRLRGRGQGRPFPRGLRSWMQWRTCRHRVPRSADPHSATEGVSRLMRDRNAPLTAADIPDLGWDKMGGLLPAVVQDASSLQLLMLGYMNEEALRQTLASGLVTFYSRSRQRLWTKGETSGNHLKLVAILPDCDNDALLVRAEPIGPTCHLGTESCFTDEGPDGVGWLARLAQIVAERASADPKDSYTARLLKEGPSPVAH